jgi:D-arabinose 1-dehydrogenase-like Zn-dependent alcohol dehydrogenase
MKGAWHVFQCTSCCCACQLRDILKIATGLTVQLQMSVFWLDQVNQALAAVKHETADGSAVILL